ncbi:MAG: hypothetical protein ACFFCZ_02600 [Promethearchaeota archaeon]
MPPKCPECHGKMEWNSPFYVCSSCGLSLRRHELSEMYEKLQADLWDARYGDQGDKKSKEKKDVLDWYLKKKK